MAYTDIHIDPLSVLVGTNASGKSNALNALLLFNRVASGSMLTSALKGDGTQAALRGDDILVIHLSDKPIAREVSQDWNTHVSYAADGTAVEVVVLDARANGALPVEILHGQAA
eukprot:gene2102-2056_t